jgi:hypothetical protein
MRNKILVAFLFLSVLASAEAQQQPERNKLRIVDTLTTQERNTRYPVILKAELDSMIQLYNATHPQVQLQQPAKESSNEIPSWILIAGVAVLLLIAFLLSRLFSYQKRFSRTVSDLKRQIQNLEFYANPDSTGSGGERNPKNKNTLEKKISELTAELDKQKKNNQAALQEYELIKQAIAEGYKVKNYPGYDKEKKEGQNINGLLTTERSVPLYAFEKFLKPVIAIVDANKNNPAKISKEDSEKLLELLVSLSLYYSEYLYLRINDLAVGGNIVQRIAGNGNGNGMDPALLKKLNTEHGSRALTLRMALNKAGIDRLTYPVFDDTDLNNF